MTPERAPFKSWVPVSVEPEPSVVPWICHLVFVLVTRGGRATGAERINKGPHPIQLNAWRGRDDFLDAALPNPISGGRDSK